MRRQILQGLAVQTLFSTSRCQSLPAVPQSNVWNSSFSLDKEQTQFADLDNITAQSLETAIRFERPNWAGNSAVGDSFYHAPNNTDHLPPGTLLRVQETTDTTVYNLPPATALSRFLFQSETLNGSSLPASGYVLWPWMPREDPRCPGKYAVVVWAHGLSGVFGECAPSHIRNLWYQYSAPYILALQGYVVVAPDYAGLGVSRYANGTDIKHTLLAGPAQANDLFNGFLAARQAFPVLSENFVIVGHSEGGAAAWAAAQRQVRRPVPGYLGAISASPSTDVRRVLALNPSFNLVVAFLAGQAMDHIFPDFDLALWLTEKGVKLLNVLRDIQACNSALSQTIVQPGLVRSDWKNASHYLNTFGEITNNAGKPFAGPMLVLQGANDSSVPTQSVSEAYNETCQLYPESQLEYVVFQGVDHVPTLYAGQRIWLDWIADRFAGNQTTKGCSQRTLTPARPIESYQKQLAYYLQLATDPYMVA
ncbi:hypothetical protein HII31_04970 [Pseudocercospora fuligena]|uniref:AB hydrolase-1 domain-containing protein n=1 Tax=Pseudocercospora fuligena TaxID=685502 RepID=A0A8H6VJA5_9PEZI|nr:hypothetical protein HII31_04970 [Pseudocercospora fuligena]